jgi:thymidylate synthase (FAD)
MQAMFLTRLDIGVIERLAANAGRSGTAPPFDEPAFLAAQDDSWKELQRSRERDECRAKLVRLGLIRESPS